MADSKAAARTVHEALAAYLGDGEIAVAWAVTIDVAGPDDRRYLTHRAGGGIDGDDSPTVWATVGMLRASVMAAEEQISAGTFDVDDEEGSDADDADH